MNKLAIVVQNIYQEIVNCVQPRDKTIVLLGAWFGNRFADNSRFLFQYLSDNKEKLGLSHVVWVTRNEMIQKELLDMGYEAYMMDSSESIYYHKKAGTHIICNGHLEENGRMADILTKYSNGAFKVNLWHGLGGIKGVSYASKEYISEKERHPIKNGIKEWLREQKCYRKYVQSLGGWSDSYYLSTTPAETEIFQCYFHLPQANFIETGYPRNDINVRLRKSEKEVINRIKKRKRIALYMPTFRNNNTEYIAPLTDSSFVSMLEKDEWLWIEKKHGADKNGEINVNSSEAILQLDSDFDANVLLPYVDLIITDYSSVSWDALYHQKPVVFYMPDYDYYMNQDRGFVLEPEEFLIGPSVYSVDELKELLDLRLNDLSTMLPENAQAVFQKFWGKKKNCAEIWEDIRKKME